MNDLHNLVGILLFLNIITSIHFMVHRATIANLQSRIESLEQKLKGRA